METPTVSKYEQEFMSLNSNKEKFDFFINFLEEYKSQASMALDPGAGFSPEEEKDFDELGDFISEKLKGLRAELFAKSFMSFRAFQNFGS